MLTYLSLPTSSSGCLVGVSQGKVGSKEKGDDVLLYWYLGARALGA